MADNDTDFYERNSAWVRPGEHRYNTDLGDKEREFQEWVKANKVPFNISAPVSDYDMRGFYGALQAKDPTAMTAVNPNDQQMHYPDYWKTPYHETFSAESQWADPAKAPQWNEKDQLVLPDGTMVYDEKKARLMHLMEKVVAAIQMQQELKRLKSGNAQ